MQIKDLNGNILKGVSRQPSGAIVSVDKEALAEYNKLKNSRIDDKNRISILEQEIQELKRLIQKLI